MHTTNLFKEWIAGIEKKGAGSREGASEYIDHFHKIQIAELNYIRKMKHEELAKAEAERLHIEQEFPPASASDAKESTIERLRRELDALKSLDRRCNETLGFWTRQEIRSIFSYIEGMAAALRQAVLWGYERGKLLLEPEEYLMLAEKTIKWEPNTRRVTFSGNQFLEFPESMDISLAYASKYFQSPPLDPLDEGKRNILRAARDIRDRLTHPTTHSDFAVAEDERNLVEGVLAWFGGAFLSSIGESVEVDWKIRLDGLISKAPKGRRALLYLKGFDSKAWISYYTQLSEVLIADSKRCFQYGIEKSFSISNRGTITLEEIAEFGAFNRMLMRSFVSGVNGVCSALNRLTIWLYERGKLKPEHLPYIVLAREERYSLRKNNIKARDAFNKIETNFDLAFEVFPKIHRIGYRLDRGQVGWRCFVETLKHRRAITHPRSLAHFVPPLEWIESLNNATQWFNREVIKLEESLNARLSTPPGKGDN